jgi:hypothetical protein
MKKKEKNTPYVVTYNDNGNMFIIDRIRRLVVCYDKNVTPAALEEMKIMIGERIPESPSLKEAHNG